METLPRVDVCNRVALRGVFKYSISSSALFMSITLTSGWKNCHAWLGMFSERPHWSATVLSAAFRMLGAAREPASRPGGKP